MNKKSNTWLQRHNPGVLFDKDTWKGVGQYAKEQFNSLKQTGNQLKKNYWDNAAGDKNFWNELANGPQRLSEQQQLNYDMGNAALNVPISAVANAIPSVYNTAAGIVNPVLSVGSKVLSMDATKKGPQLPYMNNWYKGHDFFQGGTPGMAQTQAALGAEAGGIALGLRAPKGVNAIGTAIHHRNQLVPEMMWNTQGPKWRTGVRGKLREFVNNADERAQLVHKYNNPYDDRIPFYTQTADPGKQRAFRGVQDSGINPNDYEFRGVIQGGGPAIEHNLHRPNISRKAVMYQPEGGDLQPIRKHPFITDAELRPMDNTLFKGYTQENWYSGRVIDNNSSGKGKLANGQAMFATRDPGLASTYGENNTLFSVNPSVAMRANEHGSPFNYKHGDAAPHLKRGIAPTTEAADNLRVPWDKDYKNVIYHDNATETLIKPRLGDTSYLADYLAPTEHGDFYHYVRKGQKSRLNPKYISTYDLADTYKSLHFPGYTGGYSKLYPGERKVLNFLRDNIGLGRVASYDGRTLSYPKSFSDIKRDVGEDKFNKYFRKQYPKTGAAASAYMIGSNVANANRQSVTE